MSIAADQFLAANKLQPKRGQYGRYVIADPVTGADRTWTRATTVAKILSDDYHLKLYGQRMVAHGIGLRRDLYSLVAATPIEDKQTLNNVCDQAYDAAAGSGKANLGSALHAFTERYDLGESLASINPPEPWNRDVAAYVNHLERAGIRIERSGIERVLTLHKEGIAGTTDRLQCWLPDRRLPMVGDLKTGGSLNEETGQVEVFSASWGDWAIQLALYAYADSLWNLRTEQHEPMPEVDKTRALIIHLPVGTATCNTYLVDIEAGWEAVQHALWVRDWRKRKTLSVPYAATVETPPVMPDVEVVEAVTNRMRAIVLAGHGPALAADWPAGLPTMKQGGHTQAQLEQVGALCETVENANDMPFADAAACPEYVAKTDPRVVSIVERLNTLPVDLVNGVQIAAAVQQCPKLTSGYARPADVDIIETLLTTALGEAHTRAVAVADLIGTFSPDEQTAFCTAVGAAGGAPLTGDQVDRLRVLVQAIDLCVVAFTYDGEAPALMTTMQADAYIVERHGGRRPAIAAGSTAAGELGVNKPRSVPQILADPLLTAHVATLELEQTSSTPPTEGVSI